MRAHTRACTVSMQVCWNIDGSPPVAVMKNHPLINVLSLQIHHLPIFNRWGHLLQKHKHWRPLLPSALSSEDEAKGNSETGSGRKRKVVSHQIIILDHLGLVWIKQTKAWTRSCNWWLDIQRMLNFYTHKIIHDQTIIVKLSLQV